MAIPRPASYPIRRRCARDEYSTGEGGCPEVCKGTSVGAGRRPSSASAAAMLASRSSSKMVSRGKGWPKTSSIRSTSSTASSESPPSAKKQSCAPMESGSRSSSSARMSASACSSGVPRGTNAGLTLGSEGTPGVPSPSKFANSLRCIFPVGPWRSASRICTRAGTLNVANRAAMKLCRSRWATLAPSCHTTAAATCSPSVLCGIGNATAWTTAGCCSRASSTSCGEIFSPPRLMISIVVPRTWTGS
jgi:hypothetical protein